MGRGRYEEARRLLLEAHRLDPCYAYIQLNLSSLEANEGRRDESLAWTEDALRCQPRLSLAHYYHARALERVGRADEALDEYRNTTAIDDQHADSWQSQGRLLEERAAWAEAAAAYDRALAVDPSDAQAAMLAGLVYHYHLDDSARAVDRYRAVLRLKPHHYGAHYQLAVALLGSGHREAAEVAWREFVAMADAIGDRQSIESAPLLLRVSMR